MSRERPVSTREACRLARVSYRQADYWCWIGILTPSITEAAGSGSRRRYSLDDVRTLAVLGAIVSNGIPVSSLSAVVEELADGGSWDGLLFVSMTGAVGRTLAMLGEDGVAVVIDLAVASQLADAEAPVPS